MNAMRILAAILGLGVILLPNGCFSGGSSGQTEEEKRVAKERAEAARTFKSNVSGQHRVSIQELDQLTYGYAERYFMVIGSAVDAIKRGNIDPAQRRLAHQIKLNGVLDMNDIVSGNDPYDKRRIAQHVSDNFIQHMINTGQL
jgi:hypothetical protein